ncbi:MAG: PKD domain-containing protein [Brumimicrobium sp.]
MKKFALLIITSLLFILFTPKNGFTQCNVQASICTPGTAGPFNFVGTSGSYAGSSYAPGGCATGSGGLGNDYAFITLNITTSGPLEILIDGNTTNGYLDVIIFDIPDGVAPCDAILDPNNEIACNFATNAGGCVQIGNAFPCASTIGAPNVQAGDEVMIIVHDWSDANTSFTLDLAPTGAQTGPADATIDPVGTTCLDDAPFQLTAANNGGTWSGPGVTATGEFDPGVAGVGTHTIDYTVGTNPCDDQDQTTIEVIDCSSCFISYFDAVIGACITGAGTYDVSGTVEYDTPPATGDLVLEDCNGNIYVIDSAPFANPGTTNYNITGLTADGAACDLVAYFTDEPVCESGTISYTAPICPCNFTYLSTNISACDPVDNTFEITGSIEFQDPPTTGQMIVEDCNGNQQVFNAPFTSPQNYALTGIDSDGTTNCDVNVYFTDDAACNITSNTFDYPQHCTCDADIGSFTDNVNGNATSTNPYLLCYNDELDLTGNGDFLPSQDFNVTGTVYDPGVWLLVYDCPPTVFDPDDIYNDPCLLGVASNNNQAWSIANNVGDNSTLYFVPITMYSMVDGVYAISLNNGDWCFDMGPAYEVIFLQEITTNIVEDCQAGEASVTINGGAPSLDGSNFTISNLQPASASLSTTSVTDGGTVVVSGLVDGDNYSFDIVDNNGCPESISGTFVGIEDASFTYADDTYCETQLDPSANITGTPGGTFTSAPAGLTIDPNSGIIDLSSATGTFTITYTTPDPVCFDTETFDITINPEPIIDPLADQTECESYTLPAITGTNLTGNEAYYDATNGGGTQYNPGDIITAVGTTQLYIYDETGTVPNCFNEETFNVTINVSPDIDPLADQEECGVYTLPVITGSDLTGNEAYYDATNGGGTQYNAGDNITALGTTTLYIYDETGTTPNCFDEETFDVTINFSPVINPIADQEVCDSYTLPTITGTDLTGNEAYYDATNGGGTQYNAGDIITTSTTLYIYDETGTIPNCYNQQTFDIIINNTPIIDPIADQEVCDSYTLPTITGANLTGNEAYYDAPDGGGTQYNTGDNITTPTTLYAYDETTTSPNCFDEEAFDVIINITPSINAIADQVECDSYTLPTITGNDLTGNEAYYDATNGGGTQYNAGDNITTSGTTTLYIYDETGTTPNCFDEQTFDVTINITPTFTLSSTDPTECAVSDGTVTLSGLEPNTVYEVTYSDGGNPVGPNNMTSDASGEILIDNLFAGTYSDFIVTLNGCTTVDNSSINLTDPNSPTVNAGTDQELCEGEDITLTADNPDGANISWNNGINDGVPFNQVVGTTNYTVTADLAGCISTDQVSVTVHPNPDVNAGNDILICEGETVTLTGSGADNYTWDNGITNGNSFSPNSTQTYTVTGTTNEGCEGTDQVDVTVEPLPIVSFEADNNNGCVPVTVTFTNTSDNPGTDCTWNFGDGSTATGCDEVTHTFNNEGCFDVSLEVTSGNGCTSSTTVNDYVCVSGYPNAAFTYSPDEVTTINTEVDFENGSSGAVTYEWEFGDGNSSSDINPTNTYPDVRDTFEVQLIATNEDGCSDTAYTVINILEDLIFYVPNTFTPDNDDFNESFKPIFTSGFDPYNYTLLIFNRWGEVIFESNDANVGWDGTYGVSSNTVVKEGTYVWKIIFKTNKNDERKEEIGHVNLLK